MQLNLLALLPLIAPFSLLLYAMSSLRANREGGAIRTGLANIIGIIIAVVGLGFVLQNTGFYSPTIGFNGLGFSIRLDALSAIMLTMISILGFVIMRFSATYMDGDPRQHIFMSRMAATIASVEMLILSGNLFQILVFWIITSVCLHYLLVFYRHRPQAIAAARKKFIVARLGDFSLFLAVVLIYSAFGTGDLTTIFGAISSGNIAGWQVSTATVLLVIAACLKSAQFPSHGWLIEVVETPTPVSALLHAGLLNAGPFLMVRMSYLLADTTAASVMLILAGGLTAIFASVVFLTQPSIKISLGYSSVAHMGFSLLLSGMGLYAAAILHIVAHSFYKAHAFLSSGSVIESMKSQGLINQNRTGKPAMVFLSMISALAVFLWCGYLWGLNFNGDFSLIFIGSVIVLGLSQLFVQVMDTRSKALVLMQVIILSMVVSFSFLGFEHGSRELLQSQIPNLVEPGIYTKGVAISLLIGFSLVIFVQMLAPAIKRSTMVYRLGIHLRNGLYANVLFDRMIGSLKHEKFKWANLTVKEETDPATDQAKSDTPVTEQPVILVNN